ncbi:MAG: hypothetical protein GXY52_03030 [Chloroflexi bacterium]|nr:hypothetical protein [Chloroflexota bacterium]
MITTNGIIALVERLSGYPLRGDEGIQHGDGSTSVEKVLLTWMATADAIRHAGENGCQLVIAHESLYFPYDAYVRSDAPAGWQDWEINRRRRELLDRYNLVLARIHGSLDTITIFDDFAALLGLSKPVIERDDYIKIYEITPRPLGQLLQEAAASVGMDVVRYTAPQGLDQIVHRVGLPWGGLGLFVNCSYQKRIIELGCDVMIGGESDSYGLHFGSELGVPFIELGHERSENPGIARFVMVLEEHLFGLEAEYYDCQPAFDYWVKP